MRECALIPLAPDKSNEFGYVTIIEEETRFVCQTSAFLHSTTRVFYIIFCSAWGLLFSYLLADFLPLWICVVPFLLATVGAVKSAPRVYQKPHTFFEVQKQPAQISLVTKPEPPLISLKREDTYAFYAWLTYDGEDRHEAVYHVDNKDQTTVLLCQIGHGDNAKPVALFLGNLWDKPAMLRDTEGKITKLS